MIRLPRRAAPVLVALLCLFADTPALSGQDIITGVAGAELQGGPALSTDLPFRNGIAFDRSGNAFVSVTPAPVQYGRAQ